MKSLIGLTFALMSLNVLANEIPSYYSAEFKVVKSSPMCPAPKPGQMSCMALGGKVTVQAYVGCTDKVVFTQFEELSINGKVVIHAVSLVRQDENAPRIRCAAPQMIRKELPVSMLGSDGSVELVNIEIETH